MGRKAKHGKNSRISWILFIEIALIIIMIISGTKIIIWWRENAKSKELLNKISSNITVNDEADMESKYKVDFDALKQTNPDTVAWLKVEGTQIEYPVVKGNDNDYYLNRSFDKSWNSVGWVFADYTNKFDGTDKNIVVYGHNRRDGSMFGTLKNILESDWYNNENNKYVTFITENDEKCIYEVFSVYRIEKEDYYITTYFLNDEFENFIKVIKSRSVKDFGVDVTENDTILTLSTCANDNKYRVVLHAIKLAK